MYDLLKELREEGKEAYEEFYDIYQYYLIDCRDAERTVEDLIEALGIEGTLQELINALDSDTLQEAINYIAECWDLD